MAMLACPAWDSGLLLASIVELREKGVGGMMRG